MFNNLINGFNKALSRITSGGLIREKDLDVIFEELKNTLLESDVHLSAIEEFLTYVKKEAVGKEIHKALTPKQQITKIINNSLINILGSKNIELNLKNKPSVIMLVGLQGAGKTTTTVKLAKYLKEKKNKNPIVVGVDFNRPAALEQLSILSKENNINVFESESKRISRVVKDALNFAEKNSNDVLIIDTAGRLHIDKELMSELKDLKKGFNPSEILLVVDSMVGKESVNIANEFNNLLDINGFILSKMDSDVKGGAALSLFSATKKPIKFIGLGEKADALELFYPDRIASRILDLGDILTLIEKAENSFSEKEKERLERKIRKNTFDIEDFLTQIKQIKKMGSLDSIISMIPGISGLTSKIKNMAPAEEEFKKIEAIINSMTKKERSEPSIINGSRRKRIAIGSGTSINDVNKFLKQFDNMKKMMKYLPKTGMPGIFK